MITKLQREIDKIYKNKYQDYASRHVFDKPDEL